MMRALLDRILRLVIASAIVMVIGVSLLTEAMAQETKPAAPAAVEEKPTADFTVSALSAYIWRGQQLQRDSMVIQPSVTTQSVSTTRRSTANCRWLAPDATKAS